MYKVSGMSAFHRLSITDEHHALVLPDLHTPFTSDNNEENGDLSLFQSMTLHHPQIARFESHYPCGNNSLNSVQVRKSLGLFCSSYGYNDLHVIFFLMQITTDCWCIINNFSPRLIAVTSMN